MVLISFSHVFLFGYPLFWRLRSSSCGIGTVVTFHFVPRVARAFVLSRRSVSNSSSALPPQLDSRNGASLSCNNRSMNLILTGRRSLTAFLGTLGTHRNRTSTTRVALPRLRTSEPPETQTQPYIYLQIDDFKQDTEAIFTAHKRLVGGPPSQVPTHFTPDCVVVTPVGVYKGHVQVEMLYGQMRERYYDIMEQKPTWTCFAGETVVEESVMRVG